MSKLWRNNVDLSWLNYVLIMLSTLVNNFFKQMISSSRDFKITNSQKGCNANFPCSWKMENGLLIIFSSCKIEIAISECCSIWYLTWIFHSVLGPGLIFEGLTSERKSVQLHNVWFYDFDTFYVISIGNVQNHLISLKVMKKNTWFDLPQYVLLYSRIWWNFY